MKIPPLVVCLWDRLVCALTPDGLVAADSAEPASVAAFVAQLIRPRQAVVFVYDGPRVEHVTTRCPKGGRKTVSAALAAQFPALGQPAVTWTAEPVFPTQSGSATVLHIDQSNTVPAILHALAANGTKPIAVLNLASVVAAAFPARGARIVVCHTDDSALLYFVNADGTRSFETFSDDAGHGHASAAVAARLASAPENAAPELCVIAAGAPLTLPIEPHATLSLADVLSHAPRAARSDLASAIAPKPPVSPATAALAAAVCLLGVSALLVTSYLRERNAFRANLALQQQTERQLEDEVAPLRAARDTCAKLEEDIAALRSPPAVRARFLQRLGSSRPAALTLTSLRADADRWTLVGTIHEGGTDDASPFSQWHTALASGSGWSVATQRTPIVSASTFTLTGSFQKSQ